MDAEDYGEGWEDVTGSKAALRDRIRWTKTHITLGKQILKKAGLEPGDRVRILLHRDDGRVRLMIADNGNKISDLGKSSAKISATGARKAAGIEGTRELEVLSVETGDIVASYE